LCPCVAKVPIVALRINLSEIICANDLGACPPVGGARQIKKDRYGRENNRADAGDQE
jgi:hypothetical protein